MNNPEEIKRLLSPVMVARHYLGQPSRITGNKLWYKSPFRNERTASFMVDDRSFHDFGDSWDGDVINFVERYYNTDFINATKILTKDFGLLEEKQYSDEFMEYLKQKRDEEQRIQQNLNNWYYTAFGRVRKKVILMKSAIKNIKNGELLAILYRELSDLEYILELFVEVTEEDKIELWRDREGLSKYIQK